MLRSIDCEVHSINRFIGMFSLGSFAGVATRTNLDLLAGIVENTLANNDLSRTM